MPKRQGRDDFGLNLQTRKADSVEIQKNFYVVILIETAVNRAVFGDLAIRRDDNLPRYSRSRVAIVSVRTRLASQSRRDPRRVRQLARRP